MHNHVTLRRLNSLLFVFSLVFLLAATAWAFPRTVVDDTGQEIVLEQAPERIFSTGLAIDNLLLSVVDSDRVIGVTHFAATDSYVSDRVTDDMVLVDALNAEYIVAADPDLVLVASWNDPDAVEQIRLLGYPIYTFSRFDYVEDALYNLEQIGIITGEEQKAGQLIDEFYAAYGRLASRIMNEEKPRILYWSSWGSSAGIGTSIDDIITLSGGVNVLAEADIHGWPDIDLEFILEANPDIIITDSGDDFVQQLLNDDVLTSVLAVANENVWHIDHMDALNHHFIEAVQTLAELVHPSAFEVPIP